MPDREKVEEWARDFKAYVDELDIARDDYRGIMEYIDDALALLPEQEPVDAIRDSEAYGKGEFGVWWYACGNCHGVIDYKDPFCRHCGREVKWDD